METSTAYSNHVNIVKDLHLYNTLNKRQRENEKQFEEIYERAKDVDVKLDTAKDFLNDLSRSELRTLQRFEGLADPIDIDVLSDEGAYNLLVHRYEKYDWNDNGTTEIGEARVLMSIPKHMDDEAKKTWVKALNTMGDDFMAVGVITMSLNDEYNKRRIAEHFSNMSDSEIAKMQESASYDIKSFIEETLSRPYNPKIITFMDILNKIDGIIDASDGGQASAAMIESTQRLKEAILQAQEDVKTERMTLEKELLIKQESQEILAKEKDEPLAVAIESIKETRTPDEIIAEYRAMPGQGGIAYEGMFEERIAASLAKHEPYFKREYENYEKYKDIFTPIYSNYTTQKANAIGRELNAQFPEFQAMRDKAYLGGTQEDKDAFEDMFWDYQAYNKYLREKHNMDMSSGGFNAATKESSKAYNYAVYDSLESGLSIGEATKKAQGLLSVFGGREAQAFSLMFFRGLPEDIEKATQIAPEEIDYNKQIDLRKEGFEHNFWTDAYLDTFEDDSFGIKSRIMYDIKLYSFLLENNDLVNRKLDELKERAYETANGKDWYDWKNDDGKFNENFKSGFESKLEIAEYAQTIHDKYADKIFNNSTLDKFDKIAL